MQDKNLFAWELLSHGRDQPDEVIELKLFVSVREKNHPDVLYAGRFNLAVRQSAR
jgi:hypothetical protein